MKRLFSKFAAYFRERSIFPKRRKNDSPKEKEKKIETVLCQDGFALVAVGGLLVFSAAARGVNLLLALGAMFVGFLVLDYFWGARSLRNLRVSRKLPDSIYVGEPFYVEIELDATKCRASSWAIVVEDEWEPESSLVGGSGSVESKRRDASSLLEKRRKEKKNIRRRGSSVDKSKDERSVSDARTDGVSTDSPVVYFPMAKRADKIREYYVGVITRRGRRKLRALTVSTRFPCGFFRSSLEVASPAEIVVFPRSGVLAEDWETRLSGAIQEASVATSRTSRVPDETIAIRDWRVGDSKNAIAWRATAKRERLQTREFARRQTRALVVLLDLFAPDDSNDPAALATNVEKAVSFVATIASRWSAADARVEFAMNADERDDSESDERESTLGEWNEVLARGSVRRVMTRLAFARQTRVDRLNELLAAATERNAREAQFVVVSLGPVSPERLKDSDGLSVCDERVRFVDVSSDFFDSIFQFESSDDATEERASS